jgi:hypothetical protein
MTESTGSPFGYEMFEKMWGMFREGPFSMPGMGGVPSMSMMSDLVAPLTNVEELDKRIQEMRSVEQWLKLNLNMLQSAIQALEVQRATLATLRAFGAFAQSSVAAAAEAGAAVTRESSKATESAADTARRAAAPATPSRAAPGEAQRDGNPSGTGSRHESSEAAPNAGAADPAAAMSAAFDPNGWWNLLQSQFNQIASLAAASTAAGLPAAGAGPDVSAPGTKAGARSKADDAPGGRTRPAGKAASVGADSVAKAASKPPGTRAKAAAKATTRPPKAAMRAADKAFLSVPVAARRTGSSKQGS